jgi:hypothetical protein
LLDSLIGKSAASFMVGLVGTIDLASVMSGGQTPETEDCLFLDIIVPGGALRGNVKLPVANW